MHFKRILNLKRNPLAVAWVSGVVVSCSNFSFCAVSFCLREVWAGRWTEALEKGCFTMSLGHQRGMLSTAIMSESGHLIGYKDHTTSISSSFHQGRCQLSGMSVWSHKEIKLAHSVKLKCLIVIRIRSCTSRSHRMEPRICRDPGKDHLSPSITAHMEADRCSWWRWPA